jgi:hypothetical protein
MGGLTYGLPSHRLGLTYSRTYSITPRAGMAWVPIRREGIEYRVATPEVTGLQTRHRVPVFPVADTADVPWLGAA